MSNLVSVIIPNFNYGKYISQAIDSVLAQDHKEIEIIVVDDGSTDNSLAILKEYGSKVILIENSNWGAPIARNFGLMCATGNLVAYLDADDYWLPTKISKQINLMEKSNADLVYCQMAVLDEAGSITPPFEKPKSGDFRVDFRKNPTSTPFAPSSVLMTRRLVALAGIWDSSMKSPSEDFDYFRRCSKFTQFIAVEEALVIHRDHSTSLTASSLEKFFLDNLLAVRKMFSDEYPKITALQIRLCWIKLHFSYFKSFLKAKKFIQATRCILKSFSPIYF
jgi:glycosyltransferase involved in cell wall biosynthesis